MDGEEKSLEFVCAYEGCPAKFSRWSRLEIHVRSHTGERPYVCAYEGCAKSYVRSQHLERHKETHYDFNYCCVFDECNVMLKTKATLRKHVREQHLKAEEKTYKCQHCDKVFKKHNSRVNHESQHTHAKPNLCPKPECGRHFVSRSKLKRHMKVHEGHQCDQPNCDATLATWSLYLKHKKIMHPPVYQCSVCQTTFSKSCNLNMHKKTHLGKHERTRYFCPIDGCSRSYTEEKNLKWHVRKYHEGRPFHCNQDGCGLAFRDEVRLKKHQESHDPNMPLSSKKRKKKLKQKKKKAKLKFAAYLAGYKLDKTENKDSTDKSAKTGTESDGIAEVQSKTIISNSERVHGSETDMADKAESKDSTDKNAETESNVTTDMPSKIIISDSEKICDSETDLAPLSCKDTNIESTVPLTTDCQKMIPVHCSV